MTQLKENIDRLFTFNYLLMIVNLLGFVFMVHFNDLIEIVFILAVLLCYAFIYIVPAGLLINLSQWLCRILGQSHRRFAKGLVYTIAVLSLSVTHLFIFTDQFIYRMYSFHINGFVWNLILTKGGIESLAADNSTIVVYFLIIGFILLLEICTLYAIMRFDIRFFSKKPIWRKLALAFLVLCFLLQGIGYSICSFNGYTHVLVSAEVFPAYIPITFQGYFKKAGFEPKRKNELTLKYQDSLGLNYPLNEIVQEQSHPQYNIVWMVAESLAAPMLTEEIMPATWTFSQKSNHYMNHYSGGNGTRMAVFTMFYGLYGNYWFPFMNEQRPPVLIKLLMDNHYQIELFTSAAFTYPEFDKTVFARVSKEHLHEGASGLDGWENDRINVSSIIDFLEKRDHSKPFMTFMFFESPHAPYNFPPESVIRPDYLKDFNYATTNIKKNIMQIKNRYINSCRHLDTQIERVLKSLDENSLLDSTIVIITGDHGQEFMEHGKWGHNSAFTEEQIRVPLILRVPGQNPQHITRMTSHLDLPATVLNQLGVTNPPNDYSLGYDLLGSQQRSFNVVADWGSLCYMDADCKVTLPLKSLSFSSNKITTLKDEPVDDPEDTLSQKNSNLMQVMKDSSVFISKGK